MAVVTFGVVVAMREHSSCAAVTEIELRVFIALLALPQPESVDDIERESDGDESCNKL
jgi:hypothetical protein